MDGSGWVRRSLVLATVIALGATFSATPLIATPALASSTCVDGWQQVPFLSGLAAIDAEGTATLNGAPAWIVGLSSAMAEGKRVPLIGRWTGSAWDRVAAPWKGYGVLNAVSAVDATHAWTVGSIGSYTRWPIAGRWNGSSWTSVTVPHPPGQLGVFTDLALVNGSRLWVAGQTLQNGLAKPLVMFHRAKGWKGMSPSVPAQAEGGLSDITIAPGGRVWSAGWKTDSSGQGRPWIVYRQSGSWVTANLPNLDAGRAAILDLTFVSASNGWAAGWIEKDGAGYEPLLLHWNGSTWSVVPTPWAAGLSIGLSAVEVESTGRVVVAGWQDDLLKRDVVAVLDSGNWQVTSLSAGTDTRGAFTDTAPIIGGTLVVGYSDGLPASLMSCTPSGVRATRCARSKFGRG